MIGFNYKTNYKLDEEERAIKWLTNLILNEDRKLGEINYIFCDDDYLLKLNIEFLKHDTLTDIISFDNSVGKKLHGDIFISEERVRENAKEFNTSLNEEMHRVMAHGMLHYCGYNDKTNKQKEVMRSKENYYLQILHDS